VNESEKLVYDLCRRSFLSLWSYPNPVRRDGRELCDILVVVGPDVIIFSVKEIKFSSTALDDIGVKRWQRRAITRSVKQIYRAEKSIAQMKHVITHEGAQGVPIPNSGERSIHRIAVALGSKGKASHMSADFGRGYVHILDERSLRIVLRELDTITDFVEYLSSIESLCGRGTWVISNGAENVLAYYILNDRSFRQVGKRLVIQEPLWDILQREPKFARKKQADAISYLWDRIIENISRQIQEGTLDFEGHPGDGERALRAMARESRLNRRILSQQIQDSLQTTPRTMQRSRLLLPLSGTTYVLLVCEKERDRNERRNELLERCFVARGIVPTSSVIVGIATEHPDPSGNSYDVCHLEIPEWTEEDRAQAEAIQKERRYFADARLLAVPVDEYPPSAEETS
jgi:hypothetical protein